MRGALLEAMFAMLAGSARDRSLEIEYVAHTFAGVQGFDPKSPVDAVGSVTFRSDGNIAETTAAGSPSPAVGAGEWHRDEPVANLGDDWDIRANVTSGSNPPDDSPGINIWLRLDVNRTWGNTRTGVESIGVDTSTLTFDFRLNGTSEILKTIVGTVISGEITA